MEAQFYTGVDSYYCDIFGLKNDGQFIKALWDVIRKRGAMDVLISDLAKSEISQKVKDILRYLCIQDRQSEAHYQHQNPAERRYQNAKFNCNRE